MAFSDYEHCHYCVADKEAGRGLPERHGYKGLYVGDVEVPDHINVICSHHLRVLKDEIATLRDREAQHLADIKALMGCCRGLVHDVDRLMCGIDVGRHAMVMRATLQRLAHYDDAKAVCVVDGCEKPRETAFRCCDHVIDGDIGVAWSDDAKADATAVCRPDDNACGYCSMCKASTEGGEG